MFIICKKEMSAESILDELGAKYEREEGYNELFGFTTTFEQAVESLRLNCLGSEYVVKKVKLTIEE